MMSISTFMNSEASSEIAAEMHNLMAELYPICRSITGNGVRESLGFIQKHIALETREVPTGTPVFDWAVPREWNIRDAYVKNARGEKVIDFRQSNLHVVNYSVPIHATMTLAELRPHLFTMPDHPNWIPYRTSYYSQNWGFCLSQRALEGLEEGDYEVNIDSSLEPGHLTYGECFLRGETIDEILISTHCCHPSLCNDNLSGMALATFLAKHLGLSLHRYSYRFLFVPVTIGAITWLALNESHLGRIKYGLVIAGVGDAGKSTYKKSRRGNAEIDHAAIHVLRHSEQPYEIQDFIPYGYDERQYCSPGLNLAMGSLTRTPYGHYPEYHTSADNLDFVRPEYLADSFNKYLAILDILEKNRTYINLNPKCEPQLGKRGLYNAFGGSKESKAHELALLWVLNLSDGNHTLLEIADQSDLEFSVIHTAADALLKHDLLKEYQGKST